MTRTINGVYRDGTRSKKKKKKRPPKIMTYFLSGTRVVLIAIPNYSNDAGYISKEMNGRRDQIRPQLSYIPDIVREH